MLAWERHFFFFGFQCIDEIMVCRILHPFWMSDVIGQIGCIQKLSWGLVSDRLVVIWCVAMVDDMPRWRECFIDVTLTSACPTGDLISICSQTKLWSVSSRFSFIPTLSAAEAHTTILTRYRVLFINGQACNRFLSTKDNYVSCLAISNYLVKFTCP